MSRSEYEKRSCTFQDDHPSHLWIVRRGQAVRCPGIGGDTGIVRVDTRDEALVERVAWVMYTRLGGEFHEWRLVANDTKDLYRAEARAVLAALLLDES